MIFNKHSNLEGRHAVFGASKCTWLNYSTDKMYDSFINSKMVAMGTALHEFAAGRIARCRKLPKNTKTVLDLFEESVYSKSDERWLVRYIQYIRPEVIENLVNYVNDSIGFKMSPEVVLMYSDNFFGTTDAICFRDNLLRINDLKTGISVTHIEQLMIYAALFCLEYKIKPESIAIELRIYQNNEVVISNPTADDILPIIDKITTFDKEINKLYE